MKWPLFGRAATAGTLRDRLELVLAYDRSRIAPGMVEALRSELLEVMKRYFPDHLGDVEVEQTDGAMRLVVGVPISVGAAGMRESQVGMAPSPAAHKSVSS